MNTIKFINDLRKLDINLFMEGERLRCNAPEGTLTPALKSEINGRKAEIISFLHQANNQKSASAIAPISRTENNPFPLSFAQQRLWFLNQLQPNSAFYNIPLGLHFSGQLNIAALESSLQLLINRHEILRSNFIALGGEPVQAIAATRDFTLPVVDFCPLAASEREIEYEKLASQSVMYVFNLAQEPLLRAQLVQLTPTENVLLLTVHHIIFDGWSVNIFVQELTTIYSALVEHHAPTLPEIHLQYVDFAVWQRQWLQGEVLQSQLAYWQQKLAGIPALLELPTDRPRPAVQSFRGETQVFTLEQDISEALVSLSQQQGVTLFMLLLTAFKVLLYRYTNQSDIVVSTPVANRQHPQIEGMIGFFVNNLVLRTDLSDNPTFLQLLKQVRQVVLEAYDHQNVPFEKLVEVLHPERNLSYTPLFQVALALEHEPTSAFILKDLTINLSEPGENHTAKLDLSLSLHKTEQGLTGAFEYSTDLFDATTIARMIEHWQTLLAGIVANPEQTLSNLPILTAIEQHKLLVEWNQTQEDYSQNLCIHQLFEAQVEQTPDAVAVIFKEEQLTYRELNAKANRLARHLQALGVKPETLVGICIERSLEMIVGLLGILKAGGAYVPIDPAYPVERIGYMLRDSPLPVLLTQKQLVASLPEHQARIVCLDGDWEEISKESELSPITRMTPENLAYVIYTSGSTGKPKGVKVAHQGLCNLVQTQIKLFDLHPDSRVLQFASVSFDASIWEIIMALCTGSQLYLGTREELQPGPALLQLLQEQKITHANLVPSVLAALPDEELPALQNIVVGGEECPASLVERWALGRRFFNLYGPTESTVCATIAQCFKGTGLPSIGRPIANTQIYILDRHKQPVPIGVPGELHIAGLGLARGYLNRPELTQEKFIPNPFSNELGSRLYKTGDLARYLPDGNIEYLGRIDNQVKIRGFRIELGEIEAILNQHSGVRETAVIAKDFVAGDKQLVAYVVPQQEGSPTIIDLRHFLKQKLPDYMVPGAFVVLEALPLTPNGKVDRRALPAPDLRKELEESFVAPRTPIEEMLASIWGNILLIDSVGVHDNFFTLGGHSLLATQVISRVRDTISIELPLRSLFESPTIAEFASRIEIALKNGKSVEALPLLPIPRSESIPLSFAQTRLWFLDRLQPDSAFYNIPLALRLFGQLNIAALQSSINEIIRRHEALRTNFTTIESQPVQVIASTLNCQLQVVNLLHLVETEREIELQRLAFEEVNRPFNLEQEPLLRGIVLQLGETEYVFLLTMHHIISDGWSLGVFMRELTELYKAFSTGQGLVLPELSIQYADFTIWQRQWLQGKVLETQLDYWKQQLKDIPTLLELPTDRPRPAVQTFRGAYQSFAISQELSLALVAYSKRTGVTLFMLLEAVFQTLLYRYTGQDDIVVGTPVAGRNRQEIEGLIGFFVNTLVLRTDLSGNPSFEQLLNRVREVALQAYTHQDIPFEQLVEALHPTRDLSYTPLFQVMFALDDALVPIVELPQLKVSSYPIEIGTAKFDLTLSIENTVDGLVAEWEYNTDLFDEPTIARMARHFQSFLEAIVANPKQTISELPLLTQQERQQLLVEWNNTKKEYPFDKCIHQLFEEQVEQTPEKVAVVFEQEQLTYRELNARANQLARYLKSLGVRPEVLVGICVERSLEMVVGLLGILKSGGAYVPIDPNYPQERLAFMLEDSSVPVLLTQEKLVEKLSTQSRHIVCLDTDWEKIAVHSKDNHFTSMKPGNLAYVIYTSGSTGKPKGVLIQHNSLVNYTTVVSAEYQIEKTDRILQFSSISFDASAEEIYSGLTSGATLVLRTDSMLESIEEFLLKCNNWKITILALPTAYWHELTAFLSQKTVSLPSSLRLISIGGEKAQTERWKTWLDCVKQRVRLVNIYGPTEATVGATIYELAAADTTLKELPIGRPLRNVQTYILDWNGQPVPIGVPGELHIGGAGLARGYLNRPFLTKDRFIPNPFSDSPTSRLYKTGDLVRYLPDGNIEYLGRIDNQVKIRGFRVELGEIEAALSKHPDVLQVAVIDREDVPGNKRLVAYVVSNHYPDRVPYHTECQLELDGNIIELHTQDISNGGVALVDVPALDEGRSVRLHLQLPGDSEPRWLSGTVAWSRPAQAGIQFQLAPNEQALVDQSVVYQLDTLNLWKTLQRTLSGSLRDYLKQKLPDYMIPSAFVLMKALPLTPNGKVDRRALRAPDNFHHEHEDKFVAPRNPTEAKLAAIWTQVLGLEKIGINDNFFELGGHSLQAVSLVSKLSVEMNLKVSVKLLFENPTIEELAKALPASLTPERSLLREQVQLKVEKTLPLSFDKITENPTFFRYEQRSLLLLFAVGKIAPVDSAALGYLPLSLLKETSLSRHQILQAWFDNLPMWNAVMETQWGRIATLILPIFEDELYSDPHKLVQVVIEALEMAGRLGAKTVSLTGLIPSATDYGRAIAKAIEGRNDLPKITTGHATTCSTVVLTIKKILLVSNRSLEREKVAFIGLGSIGINSLRLMLKCLPHPKSIILCDIYSKQESLQNLQRELSDDLGFRGSVQIAISSSSSELPSSIYDATLIIGATNVPDILDIDRLKSGTLIVDDSGPHCFDPEQAIKRFEKHKDILFTEGGALHAPDPIETVIYLPQLMKKNIDKNSWSDEYKPTNPLIIMGCVMSSLLSSRFDNIKPTVGLPNLETCVQHYQGLERLGFQAADLHCEGYVLQIESK